MKKIIALFLTLAALEIFAAVPIKWTVETSRAETQEIEIYHGEELALEVTFKTYGETLQLSTNADAQIFWQTNGMDTAYWRTNTVEVLASNGVMRTNWTKEMDVGAKTVRGFIGIAGDIYRASFVLRFKDAPGYSPEFLEWPFRLLDFSVVEVKNAPYYTKTETEGRITDRVAWWAMSDQSQPIKDVVTNGVSIVTNLVADLTTIAANAEEGTKRVTPAQLQSAVSVKYDKSSADKLEAFVLNISNDTQTAIATKYDKSSATKLEAFVNNLSNDTQIALEKKVETNGVQTIVESYLTPLNPLLSNSVLSVGLNIDTNSIAVLNEIAATYGGFPITGTATTVGGLLLALAAAISWLRQNKRDKSDNVCNSGSEEFGSWSKENLPEGYIWDDQPVYNESLGLWRWLCRESESSAGLWVREQGVNGVYAGKYGRYVKFYNKGFGTFETTRTGPVAAQGDTFVTKSYADQKVGGFLDVGGISAAIKGGIADLRAFFSTTNTLLKAAIEEITDTKLNSDQIADEWSSSTTYAANANVTYKGKFYKSLQSSNLNHSPDESSSAWWEVCDVFSESNSSLVAVCKAHGGTQIKQDSEGNFYYEVEEE